VSSWRDQILDSLRRTGWEWRIVLESRNLDTTIAAIESGLGVSALPRETIRTTSIREVKPGRLPVLPEISFGLFRSNTELSRAQSLMEVALASSFKATKIQRSTHFHEGQTWLLNDESRPEHMTIS
jgi:DNA-binding transcriptional LysR family regulator